VIVIGVSGGIASGKSIVSRVFEALGATIISADHVGHEVLDAPQVQTALIRAFGTDILGQDGRIVRPVLGEIVFRDSMERARLDAIVHPPLVAEIHRRIGKQRNTGYDGVMVVDAALIVEWDEVDMVDALVVVTAPRPQRIAWLMARNNLSSQEATQRVEAQLTDENRVRWADHVIVNNGSVAGLESEARGVWQSIVAREKIDPG